MPFFISFFLGIRGLANYPLESMMYGGALWFPDLTVCDPYYILPVFTAVTMFITMEVCHSYIKRILYTLFLVI
jgi:YidC/Oxa1 family membrane protein insertase